MVWKVWGLLKKNINIDLCVGVIGRHRRMAAGRLGYVYKLRVTVSSILLIATYKVHVTFQVILLSGFQRNAFFPFNYEIIGCSLRITRQDCKLQK